MRNNEHIYTPQDSTLEARIKAYKQVHTAWLQAEASLKFLEEDEWSDTLGDRDEVEQAYQIAVRSLSIAEQDLSLEEVSRALEKNLLESWEAREIIGNKRLQEVKDISVDKEYSDSQEHGHKQ